MIAKKDEKILRKMLSLAAEPEEAMTYDEMRGFLFGVAITPDVLRPSEWLPVIFGDAMIAIDSEEEGQHLLNSLMGVVNDLTERFDNKTLVFPFDIENIAHEDDFHAITGWVYGLNEALMLRPACWLDQRPHTIPEDLNEKEYAEELMTSLSVIQGIADPDEADELFSTEFEEEEDRSLRLLASLFVMLPSAVNMLLEHAGALEQERREQLMNRPQFSPTIRRESPGTGRNYPCPCGSGQKYKKCCMRKKKIVPIR